MSFKTETSCSQTFPASNNFLQHVDVPNTVTTVAASAASSLHFLQSQHLQAPSLPQQQQQQIRMNSASIDYGQQQQSTQVGSGSQLGFASEVPSNSEEEVSFTSQQGGNKIDTFQFSLQMDATPAGQLEFSQTSDAKADQLNYPVRQLDSGVPKEPSDLDPSMVKQEPLDIAQIVDEQKANISFNTRPLQQQQPVSFGQSVIDPKLAQFEFAIKDNETLHFSSQIITNKASGQLDFSPQIEGQSKQMPFAAQPGDIKLEQPRDLKTEQVNFVTQLNTADQQALLDFGSHDQTNQGGHLEFVRQQQQQQQQTPQDSKVDVMGFPVMQDSSQIGFVQSALQDPNVQQLDFGQQQHHGTVPVISQSPEARLLVCKHCQQTFYNSRDYQNHMKTQHGSVSSNGNGSNTEKRYTCEYCKKSLSRLYGLTQHIKTQHNRDKLYSCQHCGKTVTCFSELREHARTHKVNSFECRYCKKTFPRTYNLTLHIRTHTGEKPFSCTFCDKTFARSSNLVVHQRTHTGEQPFQCKDCKKCFSYSKQLKKHYSNCEGTESRVQQSVLNKGAGTYGRGNGFGENGLGLGSNSISSNDITMSITSDINSVSNASSCSTGASSTVDMPISSTNTSHTPTFIGQDNLEIKPDLGVFTRTNPPLPPLESFNNGTITNNNHHPHPDHQQQQLSQLPPQMQPPTHHHHVPHHQNNVQVKQEYNKTYPTNPVAAQFSAYPEGQTFDYRKPEDFIDPLEAPSFFTQDTMVMRQDYISNNDQPGYAPPAPQTHQPPYTTTNNTINSNQEDTVTYINL